MSESMAAGVASDQPPTSPWTEQFMLVAIVTCAASPVLVGAGGPLKLLFPVFALAYSGMLIARGNLAGYITFTIWLFLLTPELRRLIDFREGWSNPNTVMLAPYAAACWSILIIPYAIVRAKMPGRAPILALMAVVSYGLLLAALFGRIQSGVFDYLRWILPPCVAALIVANRQHLRALEQNIEVLLTIAVPLMGAYAVLQYVNIPAWDAYWMVRSEMDSIGTPDRFQVRVFSTLNSPASFAYFLVFGLTFLMSARPALRWAGLSFGAAAMILSVVRSAWLAFVLAMIVLALSDSGRAKRSILVLASVVFLGSSMLMTDPDIYEPIARRFETFTRLSSDVSFNDRSDLYTGFIVELSNNLLGQGLAINGVSQQADGANTRIIDGGPVEILLALGIFGGLIYLTAIALLVARILGPIETKDPMLSMAARATTVGLLALLPSWTTTTGETGMFFWISLGLALASREGDGALELSPSNLGTKEDFERG